MPRPKRDFQLEVYFSKWEFAARYHLTASDAQSISLRELLAYASPADRERFQELHLGYTQTFGAPTLRAAIAATYDSLEAEDIVCFAGAEEAIYIAMQVLLSPDDHCIVITPNYQAAETPAVDLRCVRRSARRRERLGARRRSNQGGVALEHKAHLNKLP